MYLPLLFFVALLLSACTNATDCPCDCDSQPPDTSDRTAWQKPGIVLEALGDIEEKVVADIGAGQGFFALRMARLADRVIAVEVTTAYVDELLRLRQLELPGSQRGRLEPRLAPYDHPNLDDEEVDIVLFVNTFYNIQSTEYLKQVFPAVKPGGRVVIVDWKDRRFNFLPPNTPNRSERIAIGEVEDMLTAAGFQLVESYDAKLEYQYIVVAEKR